MKHEMRTRRNDLLSGKVIKGLASRNMTGYYAKTGEEALRIALSLIPEGSTVTRGGCMSAAQIGLDDALQAGNYTFVDRDKTEDKRKAALMAYDCDVFIASANAMTEDGVLVNIDGNANGMNKVTKDVDAAMKRARNEAAPINAQRFGLDTPCAKTGSCMNCKSPDTICCQFLITRYSKHKDRIHVILVDEQLGF